MTKTSVEMTRTSVELIGFLLIAAGLWRVYPPLALGTAGAAMALAANFADFRIRPAGGNSFPPAGPVVPPPLAVSTQAARPAPLDTPRPWRFARRRQTQATPRPNLAAMQQAARALGELPKEPSPLERAIASAAGHRDSAGGLLP